MTSEELILDMAASITKKKADAKELSQIFDNIAKFAASDVLDPAAKTQLIIAATAIGKQKLQAL